MAADAARPSHRSLARVVRSVFGWLPSWAQGPLRKVRAVVSSRLRTRRPYRSIALGGGDTVVIDALGVPWPEVEQHLADDASTATVVVTDAAVMHEVRELPQMVEFIQTEGVPDGYVETRLQEIVRVYAAVRVASFRSMTDRVR